MSYQGWANQATWAVNWFISNDRGWYARIVEYIRSAKLRGVERSTIERDLATFVLRGYRTVLLEGGVSICKVLLHRNGCRYTAKFSEAEDNR